MVGNAPVDASLPEEDWQALLRLAATARDLGCRPATSTLRAFRTHADALSLALIHPLARGVYAPMIARSSGARRVASALRRYTTLMLPGVDAGRSSSAIRVITSEKESARIGPARVRREPAIEVC